MPRNVDRDQKMRATRSKQILDAALQAVAKKGIGAVGITDIAKESQISVGSVYTYFASKEEIFSAVLKQGQEEYGSYIRDIADRMDIAPVDKLREIAQAWLSFKNNWAYTIMIQSIRAHETVDPSLKEQATARLTENLQPIASIIREGQAAGTFVDEDPLELAFYFVSLIQGLTLQLAPGYVIPVQIRVDGVLRLFTQKGD